MPSEAPTRRGIHAIVVLLAALAFGTALFCLVATLGLYGILGQGVVHGANVALLLLILLGAIAAIRKRLPYGVAFSVLALSAIFLTYLAWDHTVPPSPAVMPAKIPEDSPSYAVYRWMLREGPGSRISELPQAADLPYFPAKKEEWPDFLRKNRDAFAKAWDQATLEREWIDGMAANAPEGVFPNMDADAPMLNFAPIRRTTWIYWAHAQLQSLDGKPDDAVRTLLPLLRTGYHLELGGASLVTQMVACVLLRGSYERLELILDAGGLSAAAKAELTATLRAAPPIQDNIGRAFLGEEVFVRSSLAKMNGDPTEAVKAVSPNATDGGLLNANKILGHFLYNPKTTERRYIDFLREACRLSQERRLTSGSEVYAGFSTRINARTVKNPAGQVLAAMALPAFPKIFDILWKTEDQRLALIKRLAD